MKKKIKLNIDKSKAKIIALSVVALVLIYFVHKNFFSDYAKCIKRFEELCLYEGKCYKKSFYKPGCYSTWKK